MNEVREYINKVKDEMSFSKDIELCNAIGAKKQNFDKWIQRNSIPPVWDIKIKSLVKTNVLNTESTPQDSEMVNIPFYKDFAVSAGFGVENFAGEMESIPFKKRELSLMFGITSFNKIGIIQVIGDSMSPTLKEGQMLVFVDDSTSIEGAIYIVQYQDEVFVKRLKKRPLELVSDNKEYSNITIKELEEIRIIGRVVGVYELNYRRI